MAKLQRTIGTTSQQILVEILDSTSTVGGGKTGLAYNTSNLTCYYCRNTAAADVAVTLATMTLGTWATGGFVQVDATNMPGLYSFSIPNAALVSGADSVVFIFRGATGMVDCRVEIELTATNNQSGDNGQGSYAIPTAPTAGTVAEAWLVTDCLAGRRNTAQGGTSTTITLDAAASTSANSYVGDEIKLLTGTGAGGVRTIIAYNTSTLVATVDRAWDTNPTSGTTFQTLHIAKSDVYNWLSVNTPTPSTGGIPTVNFNNTSIASVSGAVGSVTGGVGSVTGNVGGNVIGSVASVTGAVASVTGNVGGNVVGSVGSVTATVTFSNTSIATVANLTNAPTAGDFTATMKTSIGTAVAASAVASVTGNVGGNVTGSVGSISGVTFPSGFSSLTTTAIATAVWAFVVEGAFTAAQLLRGIAATILGSVTGAGTNAENYSAAGASGTIRVTPNSDGSGNRTNPTLNL